MAVFCGAKEVMFVGMDGRAKVETDGDLLHAFNSDKPIPGWYKRYGDRFQVRQFVVFYEYIMSLKQHYDFKIYNLGEGQKYNASTPITQELFPWSDEIKKKIKKKSSS